jgi:anti-sigma factor RsiW
MTNCAERELALNALIDGELDSLNASELEAHVRTCTTCGAYLATLSDIRDMMASDTLKESAPATLRARIEAMVTAPEPARLSAPAGRYVPWLGGGAVGAIAASAALFLAVPQFSEADMPDQLIAGHIRSLQANHLADVLTSNRHVVKPWFNGRLDFSPPVVDLAAQGFPLVGGRLDYIGGRPAAALVYRRRLHTINLFIRPVSGTAATMPLTFRRQTYSLSRWTAGGLEYWAVSDIEMGELRAFRQLFDKMTAQ